ncbi:hypothetical protein [Geothrix sp. 21YS21S-2]|uniref:hypothetical protein n=1 Tax=Geothrix sp. 21YS21S-2 TaxID=3068893 RepID=UPI0027BA6C8E|nr:hypothetical protein [Geothrix sp. 21YS21S-2]
MYNPLPKPLNAPAHALRSPLVAAALVLASGASLQAGSAFVAIENQMEYDWSVLDMKAHLEKGGVVLKVLPFEPKDPGPVAATGLEPGAHLLPARSKVLLQFEFPAEPPTLELYLMRKEDDFGRVQGNALRLAFATPAENKAQQGARLGTRETPYCTFTITPSGSLEHTPGAALDGTAGSTQEPPSPSVHSRGLAFASDLEEPVNGRILATPTYRVDPSPRTSLPATPVGNARPGAESRSFPVDSPGPRAPWQLPAAMHRNLAGKGWFAVHNRSRSPWSLRPAPGNGQNYSVAKDGELRAVPMGNRIQIPAGGSAVLAFDSDAGTFALVDAQRGCRANLVVTGAGAEFEWFKMDGKGSGALAQAVASAEVVRTQTPRLLCILKDAWPAAPVSPSVPRS